MFETLLMRGILRPTLAFLTIAAAAPASADAQERPSRWRRSEAPAPVPVTVFHSTQVANLPTAETLGKGEALFEISHRFIPRISDGVDVLWGFDGGAINRLGLSFAPSDRVMVGLLRSSLDDNLDLNVKARVYERGSDEGAVMVALVGGVAWNTEVTGRRARDRRNFQYYVQGILNVRVGGTLALGLVPSYLRNPVVLDERAANAFSLGFAAQYYAAEGVSFLGEFNAGGDHGELVNGVGTLGVELETGGHFFKVVVTNSTRLNPAQFLAGTEDSFRPGNWRVGFNITRLLAF